MAVHECLGLGEVGSQAPWEGSGLCEEVGLEPATQHAIAVPPLLALT